MAGHALTHQHLIDAFEHRFDYLSARAMAAEVLDKAGLSKADSYDAAAAARIGMAIEATVPRAASILAALPTAGAAPAAAAAPAPAAVAAPAPAPAAEAAPAEAAAAPATEEAADKSAEKKTEKKK